MPDDHHGSGTSRRADQGTPGTGRRRRLDQDEDGGKRRRSMETHGGISVADVLAKSTGRHQLPQVAQPEPPTQAHQSTREPTRVTPAVPPVPREPRGPRAPQADRQQPPRPRTPQRDQSGPPPRRRRAAPDLAQHGEAAPPARRPRRPMGRPVPPPVEREMDAPRAPQVSGQRPVPPPMPVERPAMATPPPLLPPTVAQPPLTPPPLTQPPLVQPPVAQPTEMHPPVAPPVAQPTEMHPPVVPPVAQPNIAPPNLAQPTELHPPVAELPVEQPPTAAETSRPPEARKPKPRKPDRSSLPDRLTMTDQMEPVDEATMYRRRIDNSLARFSAAHDEIAEEEAKRKERKERRIAAPLRLVEQTRTKLSQVVLSGGTGESDRVPAAEEDAPEPVAAELAEEAGDAPQASSEKSARTRLQEKKQRRSLRSVRTGRIVAAVVALLVFLSTGVAWGAKTWFNNKFTEVAALDENSADIMNAAGQTGDENFLLVGSDTRAGAAAEENVGDPSVVAGARSDTVMIAHVPADRQRAVVVSFPRDLEVARPECERWDAGAGRYTGQQVPAQRPVKLNSVYAVGGPQCVTKLVQQLSGLKMNHFVGIDFNGFKDMVDAVQGVTVHTDMPINDGILGMVIPKAGDNTISGDQALNFVRARHVKGDPTSDYGRIKRQQEFLSSLLNKAMSQEVVLDPGKLSGFVTAFAGATFGDNIGVDQMLTLAQSMQGMSAGKIDFLTVPTTGEANSRGNEVLLESKAAAIFQSLIENSPLPSDQQPAADQKAAGKESGSASPSSTRSPNG